MPLFNYNCPRCGRTVERLVVHYNDLVQCPSCLVSMTKMPAVPNMHLFPIDGIHLKNVCAGGKTFHSKNEMKKYARENNLDLGALL